MVNNIFLSNHKNLLKRCLTKFLNSFKRLVSSGEICPVNVSSNRKVVFYPTPEFKNLLQALHGLKVEVRKFGETNTDKISYDKLIKNFNELETSVKLHYKELSVIEKILETTSKKQLTNKQKIMLKLISKKQGEKLYTTLIDNLAEDLDIPKSTVRWNLKGLRESGLINAGDRENKGIPVSLTDLGRIMTEVVVAGDN